MSNVHGLLFEGFAKHKLVMRSSHRWDHCTPYPAVVPSLAWIRPALRKLVQNTPHISVATEWDYWYSRSVLHAPCLPVHTCLSPLIVHDATMFLLHVLCFTCAAGIIIASILIASF